jgi:hypothetical protein
MNRDVDLFEQTDTLPIEVANLCATYSERLECGVEDAYRVCEEFLKAVEPHGYTFEYGLDGVPHSLRVLSGVDLDVTHSNNIGASPAIT